MAVPKKMQQFEKMSVFSLKKLYFDSFQMKKQKSRFTAMCLKNVHITFQHLF